MARRLRGGGRLFEEGADYFKYFCQGAAINRGNTVHICLNEQKEGVHFLFVIRGRAVFNQLEKPK